MLLDVIFKTERRDIFGGPYTLALIEVCLKFNFDTNQTVNHLNFKLNLLLN